MNKQVIIIVGIVIVVLGLGFLLFSQDQKTAGLKVDADANAAKQGQEFPELSRTHINPGDQHEAYNSNPPTSGPHWAQPANWGVYDTPQVDEQFVHNLEHGGIWISYKPSIDADTKAKLQAIAKANPGSVVMSPREADESPIVLASWTRLEKLESYDEAKILDFIKSNKNKSPEPLAN
jgi:type II secretory pathway pseudopilin PulG